MNNKIIITDFDGTLTSTDTVSAFLNTYADAKWLDIEHEWLQGHIGSRECLRKQFALVRGIEDAQISQFISDIEIDKSFVKFYRILEENGINIAIVSDGFDFFINPIFERYGLSNMKVYSNHLEFKSGRFSMSFPSQNAHCKINAGTCKCAVVDHYRNLYEEIVYIGDGVSDFCVCNKVDLLFAKSFLASHCIEKNIDFIEFETFDEVINNDRLGLII